MLDIPDFYAPVAHRTILNGHSLAVNGGEVHAIMKLNRASKSALAYVLAALGLAAPTEAWSQSVFVKGPLDVEVPNAIVDLHNKYGRCWDRKFDVTLVRDRADFKKETERAISACAAEKAVLKREAEERLARTSDYADAERRRAAIAEAFDGFDRLRRAMAAGEGIDSK